MRVQRGALIVIPRLEGNIRGVYRTFCGTLRPYYHSSTSRILGYCNAIRNLVLSQEANAPTCRCYADFHRHFDTDSVIPTLQSLNREASSTLKSRIGMPKSAWNHGSERRHIQNAELCRSAGLKFDGKIGIGRHNNRHITLN